jgi:hypothetical protein
MVYTDKRLVEGSGKRLCRIRTHTKAASDSYRWFIEKECSLRITAYLGLA